MMKKLLLLILPVLFLSFILTSCSDNTTNPNPTDNSGKVFVTSSPAGAQIWVDNSNSSKVTPDTVAGLSAGTHTITLKLTGYIDTSYTVAVVANQTLPIYIQMSASLVLQNYGPVRLWETTGTSSSQPSGLILSLGTPVSVSNTQTDIVYHTESSTPFFVISGKDYNSSLKNTYFKAATSSTLTDTVDAPAFDAGTWVKKIADNSANYFFVYDQDGHFSKMKITSRGGGTGFGDPAWIEVTYIYNKTASDPRF